MVDSSKCLPTSISADRQAVGHAAGQRHRRMVGDVERRGVGDHLERAADVVPRGGAVGAGSAVAFIGVVGISSRS